MTDKFLVISYFDNIIGPNILYSNDDIKNIYDFPDLSRILDFSEKDNTFLFSYRKFQTINSVFNMNSNLARGGKELIMISCVSVMNVSSGGMPRRKTTRGFLAT